MNSGHIKFDCRHFRGGIPCTPNKERDRICDTCDEYMPSGKKILIIKLAAMGDVIRSTPLVTKFREKYPACHITWLTQYPDILPRNTIDEICAPDHISIYRINHLAFDIAVNLDKDQEACMLLADVNATEKFGFTWQEGHIAGIGPAAEQKLITGLFDEISKENTKSYPEEIFEICGFKFRGEEYLLNYNTSLAERWKQQIGKEAQGRMIVGLNTGCGDRWPTRLWPEAKWEELIGQLQKAGFYCVLLGGEAEHSKNSAISTQSGASYPGHFGLEEFIALGAACDIVVTQVSMMMHIATGLKKKLVLMNNIFNKHEFELFGRGVIIEPETGCDCYYGSSCKRERHCMYDIGSKTVAEAVIKLSTGQ